VDAYGRYSKKKIAKNVGLVENFIKELDRKRKPT